MCDSSKNTPPKSLYKSVFSNIHCAVIASIFLYMVFPTALVLVANLNLQHYRKPQHKVISPTNHSIDLKSSSKLKRKQLVDSNAVLGASSKDTPKGILYTSNFNDLSTEMILQDQQKLFSIICTCVIHTVV